MGLLIAASDELAFVSFGGRPAETKACVEDDDPDRTVDTTGKVTCKHANCLGVNGSVAITDGIHREN